MVDYRDWVGRRQVTEETICPELVARMAATMNVAADFCEGTRLPPCWHWLFFNPVAVQSALGSDGHPPRGEFMPPISLPRRMFAGSRLDWHADLTVGARIQQESTIAAVETKAGRSGEMVFVTVHRVYREGARTLLEEQQEIVYRGDSTPAERAALLVLAEGVKRGEVADPCAARPAQHTERVHPDPVQLFRYSAVTFNGHRIHYDVPYATGVEMYPGLVIHGPLIATMLTEFLRHTVAPGAVLRHFEFRAMRPTFDIGAFHLHSGQLGADGHISLWSTDNAGAVALDGWALCST
jgi:3-methylfumaryl-CoA hydratase